MKTILDKFKSLSALSKPMIFDRKSKDKIKCETCYASVSKKYSFCPYCGESMLDEEMELKEFGMLGRTDNVEENFFERDAQERNGFTDKIFSSLISSLMKNLEKQLKDMDVNDMNEIQNGISIKIGPQAQVNKKEKSAAKQTKQISEVQLKKMHTLPREAAKTSIRRLSDKVIYELSTPGVQSSQDIFVSKLENGYEIKAIGNAHIYVNTLPINLPLKSLSLAEDKLLIEFKLQ